MTEYTEGTCALCSGTGLRNDDALCPTCDGSGGRLAIVEAGEPAGVLIPAAVLEAAVSEFAQPETPTGGV